MTNIFDEIAKKILGLLDKKKDETTFKIDTIDFVLRQQIESIEGINDTIGSLSSTEMNDLYKKYLAIHFDSNNKCNVGYIIPTLRKSYTGKALAAENASLFGGPLQALMLMLNVSKDILKNLKYFSSEDGLPLYQVKLSTVMLLGVVSETNFLANYTVYLWNHLTGSISCGKLYPIPYQAKYLIDNVNKFIVLVNELCNKENSYTFIKSVEEIKKKNSDLMLYNEGVSFLSQLNQQAFGSIEQRRLKSGLIGFNLINSIAEYITIYKHNKYLKNKATKEMLENQLALIRYDIMGVDPNSSEYTKLVKRIELYEAEIAKYDKKLQEYMEG